MIQTKVIQLSYKVKNKTIQKAMINQFYKRKILTTGFAIVQKGKKNKNKNKKTLNAQKHSNNQNKSINGK